MKASDIAELQRKLAQLKMEQEHINYGPPDQDDQEELQDGDLDAEHYEGHDQDDEEQDEQPMMHHQQHQYQHQNYQSNGVNGNKHGYTGTNFHQNQLQQQQQMMEDSVRRLEKSPSQPLQQVLQQRAPLFENGRVNFRNRQFRIEDFEIFTTLGTGTFGRVRQVKIKGDPNKAVYALKMMKKTEIVRLNQVEHIRSETRLLQAIRHPFFVDMKTYFQDEKYVYMLFEYVSGGEMFSRLRKEGRFSNDVALFYISEILLAIEYLHRQEIVYRDLKPENLLLHRDGHIKITDFGFAKKLTNDRTYTLCGTPEYLAPEIIKGAKVGYGKSVDWWALGVLIFEMLAGYPPFYDNEPIGIYKKIIVGIIEFPQFLSLRSKDIIRKLLNPDYNRRLGVKECGDDVKRHKWFRGVDWDALYRKDIPPPWQPPLKNEEDSTWFDKYPDSKEPAKPLPRELTHLFKDL